MIYSFKHKGLEKFFRTGSKAGIQNKHAKRLRLLLALLNTATCLLDLSARSIECHELVGERQGTYSIKVSGNWRLTFRLSDPYVMEVNYEDYH